MLGNECFQFLTAYIDPLLPGCQLNSSRSDLRGTASDIEGKYIVDLITVYIQPRPHIGMRIVGKICPIQFFALLG